MEMVRGELPSHLKNGVSEYTVTEEARKDYEEELETWIKNGWLLDYDEEEHRPPKGLIPLMAVVQENKGKVRPVLDFVKSTPFSTRTRQMLTFAPRSFGNGRCMWTNPCGPTRLSSTRGSGTV